MAAWLEAKNMVLLDRNYRIPGGELDLVVQDPAGVVVFVEVRSRGLSQPGIPEETVSRHKQAFLRRAATRWLVEKDRWGRDAVRFDVVAVDTRAEPSAPSGLEIVELRWHQAAFEAPGR